MDIKKEKLINKIYGKYGNVIITDDAIYVYLKQNKLKNFYVNGFYHILFNGKGFLDFKGISNIDKKIVFYVNDIKFNKYLLLSSTADEVIFTNCTFVGGIGIFSANEIAFKHNSYINNDNKYYYGDSFIYGGCDKIDFINDIVSDYNDNDLGLKLKTNEINLVDSVIDSKSGETKIDTKYLSMSNSVIKGQNVTINSENEYLVDSRLSEHELSLNKRSN